LQDAGVDHQDQHDNPPEPAQAAPAAEEPCVPDFGRGGGLIRLDHGVIDRRG
jgi:hypothetical protein